MPVIPTMADSTTAGGGTEGLRAPPVSSIADEAEQLAVGLIEAVLAAGLGFKGPFEDFAPIAEPLLQDAIGAARRDGAQIANEFAADALARASAEQARVEAAEANLIALAGMYGEACGSLAQYRYAAVEWQGEQVDYAAAFESRVASLTAERDSLKAEITLLKKHIGALRDALDRSEARYAEAQNGPNG